MVIDEVAQGVVGEVAELILTAADQVAVQERELGLLEPRPAGDSLGLYLLAYEVMALLEPGRTVDSRVVSSDPVAQLRAAERLTRMIPVDLYPVGMVGIIRVLGDEISARRRD